jgi:hypothetical protein
MSPGLDRVGGNFHRHLVATLDSAVVSRKLVIIANMFAGHWADMLVIVNCLEEYISKKNKLTFP